MSLGYFNEQDNIREMGLRKIYALCILSGHIPDSIANVMIIITT